jgi:hypothetical protein
MFKTILFFIFIGIFAAAAVITLLGVAGKLQVRDAYLKALFSALLLGLVAAVIGLFKNFDFSEPRQGPITRIADVTNKDLTLDEQMIGTVWFMRIKDAKIAAGTISDSSIIFLREGRFLIIYNDARLRSPAPAFTHWKLSGNHIDFDIAQHASFHGDLSGPRGDLMSGKANLGAAPDQKNIKWDWDATLVKY